MVRLTSPNGVAVDAHEQAVERLLAMGFAPVAEEKPNAAKKRAPKKKEK